LARTIRRKSLVFPKTIPYNSNMSSIIQNINRDPNSPHCYFIQEFALKYGTTPSVIRFNYCDINRTLSFLEKNKRCSLIYAANNNSYLNFDTEKEESYDFFDGGRPSIERYYRVDLSKIFFVYLIAVFKRDFLTVNLNYPIEALKDNATKKELDHLIETFNKFSQKTEESHQIGLLVEAGRGLEINNFKLKPLKIDLGINYGEGFVEHDQKIKEKLQNENGGIFIFDGPPGTGKTTYIKHLTSKINRDFIFIPSCMTENLSAPTFLSLISEKESPVFVLEDAEKAILQRDTDNNSLIFNILNLSDGILNDILNVTFLVTYNTDIKNIDKAILRKGRLKYRYYFNKLPIKDAQKCIDSLGFEFKVTAPMSIGEIYNLRDNNNFQEVEKQVGFGFGGR